MWAANFGAYLGLHLLQGVVGVGADEAEEDAGGAVEHCRAAALHGDDGVVEGRRLGLSAKKGGDGGDLGLLLGHARSIAGR
jgi:hypothetical protein